MHHAIPMHEAQVTTSVCTVTQCVFQKSTSVTNANLYVGYIYQIKWCYALCSQYVESFHVCPLIIKYSSLHSIANHHKKMLEALSEIQASTTAIKGLDRESSRTWLLRETRGTDVHLVQHTVPLNRPCPGEKCKTWMPKGRRWQRPRRLRRLRGPVRYDKCKCCHIPSLFNTPH